MIKNQPLVMIFLFIFGLIIVEVSLSEPPLSVNLVNHRRVEITSNNDFVTRGWSGNGSQTDPFIISGLWLSQVYISNVNVYFQIVHCNLTGGRLVGIEFLNVENGQIINNSIRDYTKQGIYLMDSSGILISNNTISNNWEGITLEKNCNNSIIANNTIRNSERYGIAMEGSSCMNSIYNNLIINSTSRGMSLQNVFNNIISYNTIKDSELDGIFLYSASNNSIKCNNFIGNRKQAWVSNESISNTFSHNYWDDWTTPDENADGIVDYPYTIAVYTHFEVEDRYPVTTSYYIHLLTTTHHTTASTTVNPYLGGTTGFFLLSIVIIWFVFRYRRQ